MHSRRTKDSQNDAQPKRQTLTQNRDYKYGAQHSEQIHFNFLLEVPSEVLTGVTSHLDPPSLQNLGQAHSYLHKHVEDDNTWRRAFVSQYLNIGPEGNIEGNEKCLMLKRSESSWRKEFVVHYKLRRRWEKSRNVTVAHNPLNSTITSMHLMPSDSLLSSSIKYGIVARSIPLTGRVISGYIDASGSTTGRGLGNPNAEFTPNVSSCAIASDGGTARILWGFRHGEVAFMVASKVMESSRRTVSDFRRCEVQDQHDAAVNDTCWSDAQSGWSAVTGGSDGRVKLWDSKTAACLWTSSFSRDPCVKVAAALAAGCIVGVMRSGEIHVWLGLGAQPGTPPKTIVIPCPFSPPGSHAPLKPLSLLVDVSASTPSILVAFHEDVYFYRIEIGGDTCSVHVRVFGDPSFGTITSLMPSFGTQPDESSFVLTGDALGCVNIYDWKVAIGDNTIPPVRKFEAHVDGSAITALAWNTVTLLTGSILGSTSVFDGLTFERLKLFHSPVPRLRNHSPFDPEREAVRHVLLNSDKDVVFIGVGDRVMAWKAGLAPKINPGGVRGRNIHGVPHKKNQSGLAKWSQQIEMKQTITESRAIMNQDRKRVKLSYDREKEENEQRAQLDNLGLSEQEAVEYILMLSRDEATRNQTTSSSSSILADGLTDRESSFAIEGVFEGDFDVPPASGDTKTLTAPRSLSASSSSSSISNRTGLTITPSGQTIPRVVPSPSNNKVQVSPPYLPEPMEAGSGETEMFLPTLQGVTNDDVHFPLIQANSPPLNVTHTRDSSDQSQKNYPLPYDSSVVAGTRASQKDMSAWSTPLTRAIFSGQSSSIFRPSAIRFSPPLSHRRPVSSEDIDDDLRLALDLSLIEAQSRGDKL